MSTEKMAPAYAPFPALDNFLGRLKQTAVPAHIHKSLMPSLSGAIQGHLLATLKFLKLTDANSDSTDALHRLVEAHGSESWKAALATVLEDAYRPIIGDLDV